MLFQHPMIGILQIEEGVVLTGKIVRIMQLLLSVYYLRRRRRDMVWRCPSGCPSVRPLQKYVSYISKTITDLNMKLQGRIDLIAERCTAQEP